MGQTPNADYAATIPHQAFMLFQMMFAVITPALITGAFAERKKFSTFIVFILLWATFVYDPLAHWVWGVGGWLRNLGALDFAGGTVVHISSGISALAAALVIGKRGATATSPCPRTTCRSPSWARALLWFGWFGFNAGSALGANGLAAHAFMTTNTAAAAAALGWMFTEWSSRGKPTVLGAASGAVAGLVAITPAAGFVTPMASIVIGAVAGVICYSACNLKSKLGYDDSLDVVGVHGVGGTWGALATGIFATKLVNEAGGDGLLYGNPKQLWIQFVAVAVTLVLGLRDDDGHPQGARRRHGAAGQRRGRDGRASISPSTRRRRTRSAVGRTASTRWAAARPPSRGACEPARGQGPSEPLATRRGPLDGSPGKTL